LFFVAPWRQYSMLGTTHVHFSGEPGAFKVKEEDINSFVKEVNDAYPPAELKRDDITFFYGGLLPVPGGSPQTGDVKLLKSYKIIDHEMQSGLKGLISVIGVKYTTARDVASRTLDYLVKKLGKGEKTSTTAVTKVQGGDIDDFSDYLRREKSKARYDLKESAIERLIYNYGTNYLDVLSYINENPELGEPVAGQSEVLKAEVVHAVREESAVTLADVVRRRTELGSAGNPGGTALACVAEIMGKELDWTEEKVAAQLADVQTIYEPATG
jgi:glycerol-3-phosphate dehydrogenase